MTAEIVFAAVIGLAVGSFLCLVTHRLPVMLERAWLAYCDETAREGLAQPGSDGSAASVAALSAARSVQPTAQAVQRYDLFTPPSHCPDCNRRLGFLENIPLASWIAQRGRCRGCGTFIGWREPAVEIGAACLAGLAAWKFGAGWDRALAAVFMWMLLVASVIDIQRGWLPDEVTGPLLWLGLLANLGERFATPEAAVIGVVAGYGALWLVRAGFQLATGREGMGTGDLHLLAAIGAWVGWQALPGLVLLAALLGLVWVAVAVLAQWRQRGDPMPFGPMLATSGSVALLWPDLLAGFFTRGLPL